MPPNGTSGSDSPIWLMVSMPAFHFLTQALRRLARRRKGIGGEPERQAVGLGDRILVRRETVDDGDRAERLFVHHCCVRRHVGQHGRLEEIPLVADPTRHHSPLLAPLAFASLIISSMTGIRRSLAIGPISVPLSRPFPILVFFKGANEAFRELVGNLVLHQKARRRDADLTRVARLERRHDVDRSWRCRRR